MRCVHNPVKKEPIKIVAVSILALILAAPAPASAINLRGVQKTIQELWESFTRKADDNLNEWPDGNSSTRHSQDLPEFDEFLGFENKLNDIVLDVSVRGAREVNRANRNYCPPQNQQEEPSSLGFDAHIQSGLVHPSFWSQQEAPEKQHGFGFDAHIQSDLMPPSFWCEPLEYASETFEHATEPFEGVRASLLWRKGAWEYE